MANFIKVMDLTVPTTSDDDEPNIYQPRAQIDF
jgi:hypothetical protein